MTPDEARRILGLQPEDDPHQHFAEFTDARERIAEMVRKAPNETLALRYQDGLIEFDRALAVVREERDIRDAILRERVATSAEPAPGSETSAKPEEKEEPPVEEGAAEPASIVSAEIPSESQPEFEPKLPEPLVSLPANPPEPVSPFIASQPEKVVKAAAVEAFEEEPAPRSRRGAAVLIALLVVAAGGGFGWMKYQEKLAVDRTARLTYLETLGAKMVEARQWPEAMNAYGEIESLSGSPDIVLKGRRSIEAGMDDEQTQFVGYWSGEALAAFEAGRWEDAEDAAHKVLERYPDEAETASLLSKIEQAKITKVIEDLKKAARDGIQRHQWDAAEASAKELLAKFPDEPDAASLLKEIRGDRDREIRNRNRAAELFAAARLKDQGRFDREAMEWLREASALAPDDKSIAALYEKFASYTRTVHVPGDFSDLHKAIQSCGDRDRIVLGEGTWAGPLVITKAITLEGAGPDKTFIEVNAKESAAATFGPGSKGARVSGICFRPTSFDNGPNRFPALLVRGGELTASDCRFVDASGHGVAVIDSGSFTGKRCTFESNGWDGIAARGKGSRLTLEECEANNNYGHGYDAWDGAAVSIRSSHAFQNSRNGILVDSIAAEVSLADNDLRANREFGIVVSAAASGNVSANVCRENLLGGLVVRTAAGQLAVENNRAEKNTGPGLVFEQGLPPAKYATNAATANGGGKDTLNGVDFSSPQ